VDHGLGVIVKLCPRIFILFDFIYIVLCLLVLGLGKIVGNRRTSGQLSLGLLQALYQLDICIVAETRFQQSEKSLDRTNLASEVPFMGGICPQNLWDIFAFKVHFVWELDSSIQIENS
jgi:hypothetical protein